MPISAYANVSQMLFEVQLLNRMRHLHQTRHTYVQAQSLVKKKKLRRSTTWWRYKI